MSLIVNEAMFVDKIKQMGNKTGKITHLRLYML